MSEKLRLIVDGDAWLEGDNVRIDPDTAMFAMPTSEYVELQKTRQEIERLRAELDKCKAVAAETHDKWLRAVKMLTDRCMMKFIGERWTCPWCRAWTWDDSPDAIPHDTTCEYAIVITEAAEAAERSE